MADLEGRDEDGGKEKSPVTTAKMDADDSEDNPEDTYEVEKIVDMTKSKGKTLYRVRWAGYSPDWDTWEPYDNLADCHHVIDKYLEEKKQLAEQEKVAREQAKAASVDGSDTDSVTSSASRKKKSSKPSYVYVEDEDCDTLKDKFWRDLEEGKINVFGNDMYSKVKGQGRASRPTSFSEMFRSGAERDRDEADSEKSEVEKTHTRKRMRRANSATSSPTSTPGDTKSEGSAPLPHKRAQRQRESLTKQASEEGEASTSGTTGSRRVRQNRIKTEIQTEPEESAETGAETTPVRVGSGAGRRRSVEYEQDDTEAADNQNQKKMKVEPSSSTSSASSTNSTNSRKRPMVEERDESPVRERAPIVVIRRSADGNGYTQKLVEGRPRAKSSSSSDEKSPHAKSITERKLSPSRELATMDAMSPTSIKITTRCKANAETLMDTSSSKSRQTKHSTPMEVGAVAPPSDSMVDSVSSPQGATPLSPVSSIRRVWSKKDPKLVTCHIPLYDISGLSVAILEQRQSVKTEDDDNTNNNNTKEDAAATCGPSGGKRSPTTAVENIKRSPTHAVITTVMSSRIKESAGVDSMGREPIPVLRISSSPPSCRCKTDATCTASQPVYKIEPATTPAVQQSQPITTCKIEPPSSPPAAPNVPKVTQAQMASALAQSATTTPTPSTCTPVTSGLSSTLDSKALEHDSSTLQYESESVDSFINSLGSQRENEEIPGFGDIPPLSMRPSLEPSSRAQIRTSANRPLRTTPSKTSNHPPSNNQPLPPIITCQQPMSNPGVSPVRSAGWSPSDQLPGMQSQISPLQSAMSPPHMQSPPVSLQTQLSPLRQMQQQTQGLTATTDVPFSQPALRALAESLLSTVCGGSNDPLLQPSTSQQLTMDTSYQQQQVQQQQQQQQQQHHQGSFHHPDESPQHHTVCPYPTPSPTQYSCSSSSMMSPYGPSSADPSGVLSPGPHLEPMSPLGYMSGGTIQQPSPLVESPRYGPLEEPCNQFNDVDMRRVMNMNNAPIPPQLQQMNRPTGNVTGAPVPNRPTTGYNPYSPHQGASPYATSTGSPAAWSMSSPSPGTPGGPVGTPQSLGSTSGNNKLLDDTAFDFDLLEVDPSLWDQKNLCDKNTEPVEISSLELKNAVKNNDYETVRRALGSGTRYDLEMKDDSGITLLMMAAARSYDDVLELLVLNSADINARSKNGTTTLMFAAENGHRCTVELLLIMGAHMNVQTATGDTALTKAVRNGNKQIVRVLLDHGANFSSPSYLNDLTAMKVAKQRHQTEITDILNKHISWVTADFENQVNITLNNTASILCALFPMQCFALSESDHITITFNHELQPTLPGVGVLLFIAHARITSSEVRCRFYGPCAVNAATLNGYQLHPLTEEANFVMSFSPLYNGRNDLEIKTVKAPTSRAKLVVCAYKAQLSLPAD